MTVSPRPIRVLHLCQRDDPATGGAVQVAATLVRELRDVQDVDAKLVFLYGAPGAFCERLGDQCEFLNLRSSRDVPLLGGRLVRRMMTADIVHHHDMLTWSHMASLSVPGIERVMHGHVAAGVRSFGWRTKVANRIQTIRLRKFIAITEDVAKSWRDTGLSPERIAVVHNGIEMSRFVRDQQARTDLRNQLGFSETDCVLGYVGRLHNIMKGTDDFLKTLANLPDQFKAIVVGDGQDRGSLEQLAHDLSIGPRVRFVGSVDNPQRYYSALDLFLFTSRFEHFGLTPLEAIASGLPVFAFQCDGGFNEWASDDLMFRLVDRDTDVMAQLIQDSISSGAADEKALQARDIAIRRFDVSVMASNVANTYREIMGREPRGDNLIAAGDDIG